jgi:hypothetical protein
MSKYQLTKKVDGLETFKVTIRADKNDGDYLTTIHHYSKKRFEEGLIDELIELKKILNVDYALLEYSENGYADVPFDTETGENCHTLEELTVEYIDRDGLLWTVEF